MLMEFLPRLCRDGPRQEDPGTPVCVRLRGDSGSCTSLCLHALLKGHGGPKDLLSPGTYCP